MNNDIFISRFNKGRWSKAEPLGKEINTKYNETHASLSPDGRTLFFTSDRKGGIGDLDIYRAENDGNGSWGKPVNLGPEINTIFDEETPFLIETGNVLYFSSKGHNSIGGYDIFYYNFENPSEGVVNVGYPLNTTDNDLFYVPSGDGTSAYYAFRGEDSYGGRDIYKVFVQKPEPKTEEIVAGNTSDTIVPLEFIAEVVPEPAIPQEPEVFIDPIPTELPAETEPEAPEMPAVAEPIAEAEPAEIVFEEKVAVASTPEYSSIKASAYKVQVMALRKHVDLTYFKGLTGLAVVYNGDNWYRYILGKTPNRQDAENLLSEVVIKGYKDAFIKALSEYPQYTIQFMAVPGPVVDLKRFRNLSDVSVIRGNDNFCRYTTGEYATKEEALAALGKVRSLGYKRAFVTGM
jgi:septal ring-binding cell division protein DamX